jgi:large exoprotein involved in heme utilization and adhesion
VVDTSRLILRDGAQISAATLGESSGGSIFVRAREGIEAIGFLPVRETLAADIDSELVRDESGKRYPSGIFASSPGLGDVNSLAVETGTLSLQQGAQLSVSSQNQGAAGNLRVRADTARLYHSSLSAESIEGTQANIFVVSPDIQLQERSRITTNARGNATGGNITLHTDILTALGNSDISANALDNFGGRVIIHARGIVGAEFRPFPTPESDIMASSKLGPSFSGIVEINTPDVNPEAALAVLPDRVWEPMGEMVAGCPADEGNHFAVVGRGGLPEDPRGILRGEVLVQDLRPLPEATDASHVPLPESDRTRYRIPVEARGWIVNDRGAIELIAHRAASGLFPRLTCERGR